METSPLLAAGNFSSMEKIMSTESCRILSISNQKGGVGKTTTAVNLAQAFALLGKRVLLVDLDPQGNATQGLSVSLDGVEASVADLIRSREFRAENAIYQGEGIDLLPATPLLARVEREMVGVTNSEHRLKLHLTRLRDRYDLIVLDTPPTFGPLMNSALNAADRVIVPVDSSYFALVGIKELLAEVREIQGSTNPELAIFGYLLTLVDQTKITGEVIDSLVANFGERVLETKIRRSVRLREAPALGKTIFHHAPQSSGSEDYMALAREIEHRLEAEIMQGEIVRQNRFSVVSGGLCE